MGKEQARKLTPKMVSGLAIALFCCLQGCYSIPDPNTHLLCKISELEARTATLEEEVVLWQAIALRAAVELQDYKLSHPEL